MTDGMDFRFELVVLPVSDVDRAKAFYAETLGWTLDVDHRAGDSFRVVQLTPPGSACSVTIGTGVHDGEPGSYRGLHLVVDDVLAARELLAGRGVDVSEPFHFGASGQTPGVHPERASYGSFCSFSDPDGNGWLLQEVTARLPGRVDADDTTFTSSTELAAALRRAAAAHGEHEKRTGEHDENWPDWYAEYMAAEQAGKPLPS